MLLRKETKTRTVEDITYYHKCDVCGKEFQSRWEWQSCCSDGCYSILSERRRKETIKRSTRRRKERRDAARAQLPDKICVYCQQPFRPLRNDAKFCSDACRQAEYRARKEVIGMPEIKTTVANIAQDNPRYDQKNPDHVYIGRKMKLYKRLGISLPDSKWRNENKPKNKTAAEHDRVIEAYKQDFENRPDLQADIHELRGKILFCWCKPKACHGDFLAELADKS